LRLAYVVHVAIRMILGCRLHFIGVAGSWR
jgi:hypothetical protein